LKASPRNNRTGTVPVARDPQDIAFPKDLFENVRDNTLGVRREEYTAFFALLDHVQQIPTSQLEQAALKDVIYINLMTDSDRFRGEPITIIGEVVRIYPFQASPNPYNLKQLYEAWIVTKDSETHPFRVVVPTLGAGLKPGENLGIAVKVTGCFFKREGYRTAAGLHVTPTLLARRINVYRSPNQPPPADGLVPIMASVVIGFGLILTATLLSFAWADRRAPQRRDYLPSMSHETAEALASMPLFSVGEMLDNLAEQEREAEYSTLRHPAATPPPPPPRPHRVRCHRPADANAADTSLSPGESATGKSRETSRQVMALADHRSRIIEAGHGHPSPASALNGCKGRNRNVAITLHASDFMEGPLCGPQPVVSGLASARQLAVVHTAGPTKLVRDRRVGWDPLITRSVMATLCDGDSGVASAGAVVA
jgi:hypothetical protein